MLGNTSKDIKVERIPGIINPSDIFTKQIKENTNYWNMLNYMMVPLQDFIRYHHNVPSHIIYADKILPYYYNTDQE